MIKKLCATQKVDVVFTHKWSSHSWCDAIPINGWSVKGRGADRRRGKFRKNNIKKNIKYKVCCTEEFELEAAWGAMKPADWTKQGIEFHHTPMIDFYGSTSLQNIQQAVKFIERIASEGKTCYVHCKVIVIFWNVILGFIGW